MFQFSEDPPLSVYVHIPWCVRKCPYCDFNSHTAPDVIPADRYIAALLDDLDQDLAGMNAREVAAVFIGGGTPSLLSPADVERLLTGLAARLQLAPDLEVTLEANPGTVEQGKFAEFRAAGINRLSIGIQSFDDQMLQRLGRIHGRAEALRAAEAAHHAGFHNFNLDLMFGLPQQTIRQAREDLSTALALAPAHLSYYQLTIEPHTAFAHSPPPLPDDEQLWAMQAQGQADLAQHGYTQYEVSAYALADRRCRHNLNYWQFGDYLGIGAGAHSKLTDTQRHEIVRVWKLRQPQRYLQAAATAQRIGGRHTVPARQAVLEFMMNALRLNEGFATQLFERRTGLSLDQIATPLRKAAQRDLIAWRNDRVHVTTTGQRYLNDLLAMFVE